MLKKLLYSVCIILSISLFTVSASAIQFDIQINNEYPIINFSKFTYTTTTSTSSPIKRNYHSSGSYYDFAWISEIRTSSWSGGNTTVTTDTGLPAICFVYKVSSPNSGNINAIFPFYPVQGYTTSNSAVNLTPVDIQKFKLVDLLHVGGWDCSLQLVDLNDSDNTRNYISDKCTLSYYSGNGVLITIDGDVFVPNNNYYLLIFFTFPESFSVPNSVYAGYAGQAYSNVIATTPNTSTNDIISSIVSASDDIDTAIDNLGASLGGQLVDIKSSLDDVNNNLDAVNDALGDIGVSIDDLNNKLDEQIAQDSEFYDELINPSESNNDNVESSKDNLESQKDALESIDNALKTPDLPDIQVTLPPDVDNASFRGVIDSMISGNIMPIILTFSASLIFISLLLFGL